MKTKRRWIFPIALVAMIYFAMSATYASEVTVEFKIGSKELTANKEKITLEASPYIKNGTTMVPMRAIFEELGYLVEFEVSTQRIICSNGFNRITMNIGNNKAYVNGIEKTVPIAPEIVNGRTFVPLRFVSENSGAKVNWINSTSPITVSLDKKIDIGNFILTEKKLDANKNPIAVLDIFRQGKAERIEIKGKEISNVLTLNDSFVITVFDPILNSTEVMGYNGTLKTLLKDYDVKNSFEFNKNLVLHLYNRLSKRDELWRYDGINITQIDSDFNMGVFVVNENQALVSKSNSKREYTIIKFTTSSWSPEPLSNGTVAYDFIIKDYIVDSNIIYLLGIKATGDEAWFYTYKITGTTGVLRPIKVASDQKVTLNDVFQTDTNIYVKLGTVLHVLTETDLKPVEFYDNGTYVHLKLGDTQVLYGKLYANVTSIVTSISSVKTSSDYKTQTDVRYPSSTITGLDKTFLICLDNTITFTPTVYYTKYYTSGLNTILSTPDYKNMKSSVPLQNVAYYRNTMKEMAEHPKKDIKIASMQLYQGRFYLLGTNFDDDNYLNTWNADTLQVGIPVLDILSISDFAKLPDGTVILSVKDFNRLNDTTRYTLLELKQGVYRNVAVDTKAIQMVIKSQSLLIYGQDVDLKKTKLFSYNNGTFVSIGNTFTLNKWNDYEGGLTVISGKSDTDTTVSVFVLTNSLTKVIPDFTMEKMVRLNANIYGIVGKYTTTSIDADFKSKKVMLIYNAQTTKSVVVKASTGFEVTASEYSN